MGKKGIMSLMMAIALLFSLGGAYAAAETDGSPAPTAAEDFDKAGLSKILWVAEGIVLDPITGVDGVDQVRTFTYSFTPQASGTVALEEIPAMGNREISVEGDENTHSQRGGERATGYLSFTQLFGSDPEAFGFPHAGEYVYTVLEIAPKAFRVVVTEDNGSYAVGDENSPDSVTKTLELGNEAYNIHLYVVNDGDGLAYSYIRVWTAVYDAEKEIWADDEKIDPTIIRERWEDGGEEEFSVSHEFRFNNKYTEVIKRTTDGEAALSVHKEITGTYADKTKTFPVSVKLHIPGTALATAGDDIVLGEGLTISPKPENGTTTQDYTVSGELADGDVLRLLKVPAGTTFRVQETQDLRYRSKTTGFVKQEDTEYRTGNVDKEGKAYLLDAEKHVNIENNREDLVPTGLVIDSLPYLLLAVLAVGGLVFLGVRKKADKR